MSIKWKIAGYAVVVLLLVELVAWFYFKPAVGGPITSGAWAGSSNYFCSESDGVLFVEDHHIIATDGTKSHVSVWIDVAGTSDDPRLIFSRSHNFRTEQGWVVQAHISGDRLTFLSIAPSINGEQVAGDVGPMKKVLDGFQDRQPFRRCIGMAPPASPISQ